MYTPHIPKYPLVAVYSLSENIKTPFQRKEAGTRKFTYFIMRRYFLKALSSELEKIADSYKPAAYTKVSWLMSAFSISLPGCPVAVGTKVP
jgi:hypothetical protein